MTARIVVPARAEAGYNGLRNDRGAIAAAAADWEETRRRFVSFADEILPNLAWRDRYLRYAEVFDMSLRSEPIAVATPRCASLIELVTRKRKASALGASGCRRSLPSPMRSVGRLLLRAPRTCFLPPASSCVDAPSEPQV